MEGQGLRCVELALCASVLAMSMKPKEAALLRLMLARRMSYVVACGLVPRC